MKHINNKFKYMLNEMSRAAQEYLATKDTEKRLLYSKTMEIIAMIAALDESLEPQEFEALFNIRTEFFNKLLQED